MVCGVRYSLLYYFSIVLLFTAVNHAPLVVRLPFGGDWSPYLLLVGLWFVLRDYSQRELGGFVLLPMIAGILTAYLFIDSNLALASAIALAVSETVDAIIYTLSKRPFHQRVLISSAIAIPIDTAVFFAAVDILQVHGETNFFNFWSVLIATLTKIASAVVVFYVSRRRSVPH
jgi:queuosine precursor transporter